MSCVFFPSCSVFCEMMDSFINQAHPNFFDCLFIALSNHRNFILNYCSPHCHVLVCCWLVTFPTELNILYEMAASFCWFFIFLSLFGSFPNKFCYTAPAVWSLLCLVTHLPFPLSLSLSLWYLFLFCFTAAKVFLFVLLACLCLIKRYWIPLTRPLFDRLVDSQSHGAILLIGTDNWRFDRNSINLSIFGHVHHLVGQRKEKSSYSPSQIIEWLPELNSSGHG